MEILFVVPRSMILRPDARSEILRFPAFLVSGQKRQENLGMRPSSTNRQDYYGRLFEAVKLLPPCAKQVDLADLFFRQG